MNFRPGKKSINGELYVVESNCGRYTVSRSRDDLGWRYCAWFGREPIGEATRDRYEAEAMCVEHAQSLTTEREFKAAGAAR